MLHCQYRDPAEVSNYKKREKNRLNRCRYCGDIFRKKRYNIERCRSGSFILLLSKLNIDTQKQVNPYVWRRDLYITQTLDIGLAKVLFCLLLKSVAVGQGEGSSGARWLYTSILILVVFEAIRRFVLKVGKSFVPSILALSWTPGVYLLGWRPCLLVALTLCGLLRIFFFFNDLINGILEANTSNSSNKMSAHGHSP